MCWEELTAFLAYFGPLSALANATISRVKDEESDWSFEDLRYLLVVTNSIGLLILASCNYPLL